MTGTNENPRTTAGASPRELTTSNQDNFNLPGSTLALLEAAFERVIDGSLGIDRVPLILQSFFFLGEVCGRSSRDHEVAFHKGEADRLWNVAFGNRKPLKIGATFAELCRLRGDLVTAERIEAEIDALRFEVTR